MAKSNGGARTTALAVIAPEAFPLAVERSSLIQAMRANLGDEPLRAEDLTRIKAPAAGGTTWEIPTIDGDTEAVKEIDGVILHICRRRAYWNSKDVTNKPPDCYSLDCVTGIGQPGGECAVCPCAEFGSAASMLGAQGEGKACKERRFFFVLRSGQQIPDVISAPPGSLKSTRKYLLDMSKLGLPYWSVVTRFSLAKVAGKSVANYSEVRLSPVGKLDADTIRGIQTYAQQLGEVFSAVSVDHEADDPHETTEI